MNTYIFKRGKTIYVFHEENEDCAWNKLQSKLSWNIKIVKQKCELVKILTEYEHGITEIKVN